MHTKVTIRHVDFQLFNKMLLEGTLVMDHNNDTLLYAGAAKVNITDWFFFKDSITLKYVGLDDAVIYINRKDSSWNYQFLADYFFPTKKKTGNAKPINLDLKIIELNRLKIIQHDEWVGQNMLVYLNALKLYTDDFNPNKRTIKINTLTLDNPVLQLYNYKGLQPNLATQSVQQPLDSLHTQKIPAKGYEWNTNDWLLVIKDLQVKNGNLALDRASNRLPLLQQFDAEHINLSAINAKFTNLVLFRDTITSDINISVKDRSGFEIKKLNSALKFTPRLLELNNLDLITNKSHIKNYLAARFIDFNKDFANFEHAVTIVADFKDAEISSDDIGFFSPDLRILTRMFSISGNILGTVDNFSGRNMLIHSGKTNLEGDISLRGLPYINKTFIDFHGRDFSTNYNELINIVPILKTITNPRLSELGNIRFKGNFTGFINDFVTFGTLGTDLGTVTTDLNMKLPRNSVPVYSGKLSTDNFQLGKFLTNSQVGNISFNGKISGKGFTAATLDLAVDGTIKEVKVNQYNYQKIVAKGNFKNNLFEGSVSIDDPNLKIDYLLGSINFNGKAPQFNFDAEVSKFYMKNLGLTNENFSLTGTFNLNFSGNNIDNFLGAARIYNAVFRHDDQRLSFDSLSINSTFEYGKKHLTIQTNELDASVIGSFTILDLPDAFILFLNRYYPAYIRKPLSEVKNQDFSFDIKTKDIQDYLALVNKKIKGFNNTEISGDLNLTTNTLNILAKVPSFSYATTDFSNVNFTGKGTFDSLVLVGNVEDVVINDSLHLPDTKILITAHNDISDVSIKTTASKTLNDADLSVRIQTLSDGFKLDFNPSSFVINEKKWILEKGGELVLSKSMFSANEVKFVQQDQELTISTEPSGISNSNDVIVQFKKLNMGDFMPFLLKNPRLEGTLTGNVRVNDPFGNMTIDFNTRHDQFRFENDSIGIVTTSGNYTSRSGDLNVSAISDNRFYNFTADLAYHSKDSGNNQLKGNFKFNHSDIHILEKYIGNIFSGIHGNTTGQLFISGRGSKPVITGSVVLNDVTMTVNYTRCRYIFENNSLINFNPDEIDLGSLKIRDTLNNTATVSGKLYHAFFDNFFFNELNVRTDRRNGNLGKFLLLNTTSKDNKQFYGKVVGDAELSLNGPASDMRMNISGQPTDSSQIYLTTDETAEGGKIDYMDFIKFGREMQADLTARVQSNIKVDMELTANPYAKIDVILDEITGDVIKAQGSGKLNISVGSNESLTIRGRYDILQGQYTFNFQTFLKTPFTLQQGYIEWQGDPYLANLNMDALYRATNVDLSNIPTSNGLTRTKGDIDIIFKLRGTLKDPKPDFEFLFPFDNPLRSDPIANEFLKTRYQADKNELNKQVTSLLLFNSFMSDQQRLFSTNNTFNFATRTLGQILSTTLSSSLNNWLQKLLNTSAVNLYTNINTADFNFNGSTQAQIQNLGNFGFKTTFLKNRLLINFGGNVDYRLVQSSSNSNSNFLFTPDVSFEYLITPDGKFRVIGFNRSDADIGDLAGLNRRNRTGLLLSYRKDFDTFAELFGGRK